MSKNFLFRKFLMMLMMALILWSVLTSLVYNQIASPVFQRIKSDDLFDQASVVSYIASQKNNDIDKELIDLLALSIRFYETGAFITNQDGDVLIYKFPNNIPETFFDDVDEEFYSLITNVLSDGKKYSKVVHLDNINQDLLLVAMPIVNKDDSNQIIGSVIMMQTMQELKASYLSLNVALLISAFIVGLIVVIPIIFMTSHMVRPLTDMRNAASAMIEGDFSHRLKPLKEDNEISYLVNAFNHLSGELDNNISKLTNERNQLQHIINGIAEGIVAVDAYGNVTHSNDIIWQLFHQDSKKYSADELLKITDLNSLFESCLIEQKNIMIVKHSGDSLINCLISPLYDRSNMLFGAVGLFRDVTESEKLEQTRHEYVSNVSHELRTPITAMRGLLEPLNDGLVKSEEKKQQYYAILLRESIRLSHLVDDMLELSRIQTSERTVNLGPVNLHNDLIDMAIRFEVLAEQKNIHFKVHNLNEVYPAVWGKADRITQIMTTIMENAVKFTKEDGEIDFLIEADKDHLSLSIKDTGTGIKPEDLPYVFERFYKADKSHNEMGTGLGLSIAAELAKQMGHRLSVTSKVNEGSIFTLSMPYAHDIMKSEPHLKDVYESDVPGDDE